MNWDEFVAECRRRPRPLVVAHRGASLLEPENTLRAFLLGLVQGADALETDLRFTRDGQIVLFHDATLERTTDGRGRVADHTLAELQQLRTRRPDGALSDERIPTLDELIAATGGQAPLLLELKDERFQEQAYAEALVRTLAASGMMERSAVVSFHPAHVAAVQRLAPELPRGYITLSNPLPRPGMQLLGPLWPLLYLNPFYVAMAHRLGAIVAPLDTNPAPRMRTYLRLDVDAVLDDCPARAIQAMDRILRPQG
jgi:glycerophosphoryl diester phosphodiesterase